MLDTALGFSLMVSVVVTTIVYVVTRDKKKTEQEQKDKLNDTIIVFVITFIVVLFGKLCIGESSTSTTLVKVTDVKGGQCPF
tara:strand:+ start:95 stop:340 length:246 start_codon:yes stop_codon:yes gene_type:complete